MENGKRQMDHEAGEDAGMENGKWKMEEGVETAEVGAKERAMLTREEVGRMRSFSKLLVVAQRVGVEGAERIDSTEELRVAILARVGEGSAV